MIFLKKSAVVYLGNHNVKLCHCGYQGVCDKFIGKSVKRTHAVPKNPPTGCSLCCIEGQLSYLLLRPSNAFLIASTAVLLPNGIQPQAHRIRQKNLAF